MSLWDAQMLHSKGRLALDRLPQSFHGDPADGLIVATAHAYGLPLATQDRAIQASGVIPIWPGRA